MAKTKDLTVTQLHEGAVQEETWTLGESRHLVRLKLFRRNPAPPLYSVDHRVFHMPVDNPPWTENRVFLFDGIAGARSKFHGVRRDPPTTYVNT